MRNGGVLADRRLDDRQVGVSQAEQVDERPLRDRLLDQPQNIVRLAHGHISAKALEQELVLWIVDPGDGLGDLELVFRHLADHEVVLVFPGHCHEHVCACRTGRRQHRGFGAVAFEHDGPEALRVNVDLCAVLFDQQDLVSFPQERFGKVIADLAAADDDDIHAQDSLVSRRPSALLAPITWSMIIAEMVVVGQTVPRPSRR